MTRKTRWTIIGLVILLGILLVLWLVLFFRAAKTVPAPVVDVVQENKEEDIGLVVEEQEIQQEQQTRVQALGATTVSKTFVERYGSYSNEAEFQNLFDVLPLMTLTFAEQTRAYVLGATLPEAHYGVTTRVLTVSVEKIDEQEGLSTMVLQTQREITQGSTQNTSVTYQQIRLELKKEEGVWKVDSAVWQ